MTKPPKDTIQLIAPELNPAQVDNIYRYIRERVIGEMEDNYSHLHTGLAYDELRRVAEIANHLRATQLERLDKYFRRDG